LGFSTTGSGFFSSVFLFFLDFLFSVVSVVSVITCFTGDSGALVTTGSNFAVC